MRREEFKMERMNLVEVGEGYPVTEGKLPSAYYYTLGKAYAMSGNFEPANRIRSREGKVIEIEETPRGHYVTVEFDEDQTPLSL